MESSIASLILSSFSRNLEILARIFRQVITFSTLPFDFYFFTFFNIHNTICSFFFFSWVWLTTCFIDEKLSQRSLLISKMNWYICFPISSFLFLLSLCMPSVNAHVIISFHWMQIVVHYLMGHLNMYPHHIYNFHSSEFVM